MAIITTSSGSLTRTNALDVVLFDICDGLQLTKTRHGTAEGRYHSIADVIRESNLPFSQWNSKVYPQGSMRLRTTVKPIESPHDLDLVCEFDVHYTSVNAMSLLDNMFDLFREHGVYGGM